MVAETGAMAETKPPEAPTALAETREYTIDELAARSGVPSRTIRFYQANGALQAPEIRGRKAIYFDAHLQRLELVGQLQERGLRIRAIRDLMVQVERGELGLDEWLGLQDKLHQPWTDDSPRLFTRQELQELAGPDRKHVVADLGRLGLVTAQGDRFLAESPALLGVFLRMERAGIDLAVAKGASDLVRANLNKLAAALVKHYVKHAGDGFGTTPAAEDLAAAFDAVPARTSELVELVFGQEMERALREVVSSGQVAKLAAKKR